MPATAYWGPQGIFTLISIVALVSTAKELLRGEADKGLQRFMDCDKGWDLARFSCSEPKSSQEILQGRENTIRRSWASAWSLYVSRWPVSKAEVSWLVIWGYCLYRFLNIFTSAARDSSNPSTCSLRPMKHETLDKKTLELSLIKCSGLMWPGKLSWNW